MGRSLDKVLPPALRVVIFVPRTTSPDSAETPATGGNMRIESFFNLITHQIDGADNPGTGSARAVAIASEHRRDAVEEFRFSDGR